MTRLFSSGTLACGLLVRIGFHGPPGKLSGLRSNEICGFEILAFRMTLAVDFVRLDLGAFEGKKKIVSAEIKVL